MASLDVLDYLTGLEEALAPLLPRAERRLAVKEARKVVEDLAFRLGWLAERRVPPEDIDFVRAIECLRPAPEVARVLARRKPIYRRRVIRRQVMTIAVLSVLLIAGVAFANFLGSEKARIDLDFQTGADTVTDRSEAHNFTVASGATRLQLSLTANVAKAGNASQEAAVEFTLLDPRGNIRYQQRFTHSTRLYDSVDLPSPGPGEWALYVDFHQAVAAIQVKCLEVSPA